MIFAGKHIKYNLMKSLLSTFILFCLVLFTSCNTVRVSSDFDRNTDFSKYKTFTFHEGEINKLKMNSLDKKRIITTIGKKLVEKSLTPVQSLSNADLIVNISAYNKNRIIIDAPWYDPWLYGPLWRNPYNMRNYHEGTLVIDLIDAKQNTLVWQGIGTGLDLDNIEKKAIDIPKSVNEILAKFPPVK